MLARALSVALAICAGCGRIGFDEATRATDGGNDGSVALGPWGQPVHLGALSSNLNDWEGTIDATELVLVFARQSSSNSDLWVTTRASAAVPFGAPSMIAAASTSGFEVGAAWSFDNARLYFYFDDGSTFMPRYLDNLGGGAFSAKSQPATELPPDGYSWTFSRDGREVFYTTNPSQGEYDLHHATRASTTADFVLHDGDIAALQRAVGSEGWPTLDSSQNRIYFEREVSGVGVIYEAARSGPGADFGVPTPVDYLDANDGDPDLSGGDLTLVFNSDRLGGGLGDELFIMTRTGP